VFYYDAFDQFSIVLIKKIQQSTVDLSINNNTILLLCITGMVITMHVLIGYSNSLIPNNWQYTIESIYQFVFSIVSEQAGKLGYKYFPHFYTIFILILFYNLVGLLPFSFTVSSQVIITLALILSVVYMPNWLLPLLTVVETLSFFLRPVSLGIRLFANRLLHTLLYLTIILIIPALIIANCIKLKDCTTISLAIPLFLTNNIFLKYIALVSNKKQDLYEKLIDILLEYSITRFLILNWFHCVIYFRVTSEWLHNEYLATRNNYLLGLVISGIASRLHIIPYIFIFIFFILRMEFSFQSVARYYKKRPGLLVQHFPNIDKRYMWRRAIEDAAKNPNVQTAATVAAGAVAWKALDVWNSHQENKRADKDREQDATQRQADRDAEAAQRQADRDAEAAQRQADRDAEATQRQADRDAEDKRHAATLASENKAENVEQTLASSELDSVFEDPTLWL
jgi:F-type H+-transporting ATPase subunit a